MWFQCISELASHSFDQPRELKIKYNIFGFREIERLALQYASRAASRLEVKIINWYKKRLASRHTSHAASRMSSGI